MKMAIIGVTRNVGKRILANWPTQSSRFKNGVLGKLRSNKQRALK